MLLFSGYRTHVRGARKVARASRPWMFMGKPARRVVWNTLGGIGQFWFAVDFPHARPGMPMLRKRAIKEVGRCSEEG